MLDKFSRRCNNLSKSSEKQTFVKYNWLISDSFRRYQVEKMDNFNAKKYKRY
jgi:hypothetical protein